MQVYVEEEKVIDIANSTHTNGRAGGGMGRC